jgi:hypothetical protein
MAALKDDAFWDIASCNLLQVDRLFREIMEALIMETVRISETSVYFHETTEHSIPEGIVFTLAAM